jgi:peptide/nickel transport system substrate-binding protein/microcin C transport system substrate-binding protein
MKTWLLSCMLAVGLGGAALANPHVHGSPEAKVQGVRRERFAVQPASLHPLNATDFYGNRLLGYIYESLAETDVETLEHVPLLAQRWEIAPDKKSFTFYLHPEAKWQDGEPVTAEDVKFSFDVLFHKKLKTRGKWLAYYSNFAKAQVLAPRTVRFTVRRDHFLNFVRVAGLRVVPKHKFRGDNPNRTVLSKKPMGSGPYAFKSWRKGSLLKLTRHNGYWGRALPQNVGRFNHRQLFTKIVSADRVALETLKKGELDLMRLTPDQWVRETSGEPFGLGPDSGRPIIKLDVQNKAPRGYRYVGYNLESFLFRERGVRRAISHLFDRDTYIEKFYQGLQVKAVGPFEANSRYSSPRVRQIGFSIPQAIRLLREAGWQDSDGDNLLDKEGRPFRFTIMTADPETSVKILTLAKEAMRKAGVELNIKVVDWTSFLQLIDELKFDAVMLGWSRGVFPDPTPLWHSKSAVKGGLNFVRYRNPEVDRLIDAAVKSIPETERVKLYRRIHERIYEDQPYTFLLERNHMLLAYKARFRHVKPWYAYAVGEDYWWVERPSR